MDVLKSAVDEFYEDTDRDVTKYSSVPELCTTKECYVGIDEAGRGPVLGAMVYSAFCCVADNYVAGKSSEDRPATALDKISKLNDSKVLTEEIRDEIFTKFSDSDCMAFGLKIISPSQISMKCFKRQKTSLNDVSHEAAIELIQGLCDRGVKIAKVYVDTVGPMEKYQKKLEGVFPDLKFKVDKKADSKYKPVSAASICAKVTRDFTLKNWKFPAQGLKVNVGEKGWGSGYPGDDVTKKFLKQNADPVFGFPNIVRNSWSTASNILENTSVNVIWEDCESENDSKNTQKIGKFFGKRKKDEPVIQEVFVKRSPFFSHRNLQPTSVFF